MSITVKFFFNESFAIGIPSKRLKGVSYSGSTSGQTSPLKFYYEGSIKDFSPFYKGLNNFFAQNTPYPRRKFIRTDIHWQSKKVSLAKDKIPVPAKKNYKAIAAIIRQAILKEESNK